jgi:hypothetical protein
MDEIGFAAGAQRLGLDVDDARQLMELRRAGDCATLQRRMAELVAGRLEDVTARLDGALGEQGAVGGVGGGAGVEAMTRSIPLAKEAGMLQAAADILAARPGTGGCADDCACTRAASVTGGAYLFSTAAATAKGQPIACTLDADGGDMAARLGEWRSVLAEATGQEQIEEGIAVTFPHGVARTVELARLLAAEYSCCSFASYHLTIDASGVRMEVRTPPEARDAMAAVFGTG